MIKSLIKPRINLMNGIYQKHTGMPFLSTFALYTPTSRIIAGINRLLCSEVKFLPLNISLKVKPGEMPGLLSTVVSGYNSLC